MLKVSCIFFILFLRFLHHLYYIALNSFSESLSIFSLFTWFFGFLPCSFTCMVFPCLSFCLTHWVWGLLSPGCRVVLLAFGLCAGVLYRLCVGRDFCLHSGGRRWVLFLWWIGSRAMVCLVAPVQPVCCWCICVCLCEASSTGCCRQMGAARSWIWVEAFMGVLTNTPWHREFSDCLVSWTWCCHCSLQFSSVQSLSCVLLFIYDII